MTATLAILAVAIGVAGVMALAFRGGRRAARRATERELIARTDHYAKRHGLSHRRGESARDYEARVFEATATADEAVEPCGWRH